MPRQRYRPTTAEQLAARLESYRGLFAGIQAEAEMYAGLSPEYPKYSDQELKDLAVAQGRSKAQSWAQEMIEIAATPHGQETRTLARTRVIALDAAAKHLDAFERALLKGRLPNRSPATAGPGWPGSVEGALKDIRSELTRWASYERETADVWFRRDWGIGESIDAFQLAGLSVTQAIEEIVTIAAEQWEALTIGTSTVSISGIAMGHPRRSVPFTRQVFIRLWGKTIGPHSTHDDKCGTIRQRVEKLHTRLQKRAKTRSDPNGQT